MHFFVLGLSHSLTHTLSLSFSPPHLPVNKGCAAHMVRLIRSTSSVDVLYIYNICDIYTHTHMHIYIYDLHAVISAVAIRVEKN